jgi:cytochrome c5
MRVRILGLATLVVGACDEFEDDTDRVDTEPGADTDCCTCPEPARGWDAVVEQHAADLLEEGRATFRSDTFGDESFWTGALHLNEVIEGSVHGGIGDGLTPAAGLALGLKVDVDRLPASIRQQIVAGQIDLENPEVTIALLRLEAVVGIRATVDPTGSVTSVGITCALCHATVDDSLAPGIGHELDGWANRDLDVGRIIALAPDLTPFTTLLGVDDATVRSVLTSWGPGKFDAELVLDGKAVNPYTGMSGATLIPPAYGLAGIDLHTWTGWGGVSHWNAFVANLAMHGHGTFTDARLDDPAQYPVAAANGFGHVTTDDDRITPKLPGLHLYQLAIPAPTPPAGSFDAAAAGRGAATFGAACAGCHVPPIYTDPGWNLHTPEEIGIDPFQADRGPDHRYRTSPLKGLWAHGKGGYYHDGRFATLRDVVDHYDGHLDLGLSNDEKDDLVQYLLSL